MHAAVLALLVLQILQPMTLEGPTSTDVVFADVPEGIPIEKLPYEIGLVWDPNPEPNVAGYVLYSGPAPGTWTGRVDVAMSTLYGGPGAFLGFTTAGRLYFAVAAYSYYYEEPVPPQCPDGAVVLNVGAWDRNVPAATLKSPSYGRVTYSLLSSKNAVTALIIKFNGVEQDRLTGSDLRRTAASYFAAGMVPGAYQLSVEAQDANGCSAGADRPMTVNVKGPQ
jgi:hypothetical protein